MARKSKQQKVQQRRVAYGKARNGMICAIPAEKMAQWQKAQQREQPVDRKLEAELTALLLGEK